MTTTQRVNLPGIAIGREAVRLPSTGRANGRSNGPAVPFEHLLGRSLGARQASSAARSGATRFAAGGTSAVGVTAYRPLIEATARRYGLDPALLLGVVESESGFNPQALSSAGAKGLMQLMDGTARGLGVTDPYSPEQSVDGGARLLRDLLSRYDGSTSLALAAYNAGPGAVDKHGGIPPYSETRTYVARVLAAASRYGG